MIAMCKMTPQVLTRTCRKLRRDRSDELAAEIPSLGEISGLRPQHETLGVDRRTRT